MANPRKTSPKREHGTHAKYTGRQANIAGLAPNDRAQLVQYVLSRTAYSVAGKPAIDPSGAAVRWLFPDADINAGGPAAMDGAEMAAYAEANPDMAQMVDEWEAWANANKRPKRSR
jgi:hypothetical protein